MRTHILAVDPGLKPGVAEFEIDDAPGPHCGVVRLMRVSHKLEPWVFSAPPWDLLVTELQWYFGPRKNRGAAAKLTGIPMLDRSQDDVDVNSVLKLAFRAGATMMGIPAVRRMALKPQVWRGTNATKEQVQARIARDLTPAERALFAAVPKSRHGDILDAVGIGRAAIRLAPTTTEYDFSLT